MHISHNPVTSCVFQNWNTNALLSQHQTTFFRDHTKANFNTHRISILAQVQTNHFKIFCSPTAQHSPNCPLTDIFIKKNRDSSLFTIDRIKQTFSPESISQPIFLIENGAKLSRKFPTILQFKRCLITL